jgi:hypothetical protein
MRFVSFDTLRNFRPVLCGAQIDMAKRVFLRCEPRRIVERPCRDCPDARDGFKGKSDVRSAAGAKLLVQPATRFVRNVPVFLQRTTSKRHFFGSEHRFNTERRPGTSLTPGAMANCNALRLAVNGVAHASAHTATFVLFHHIDSSSPTQCLMIRSAASQRRSLLGSSASCKPSPTKLKAITVRKIRRPGHNASTGAW